MVLANILGFAGPDVIIAAVVVMVLFGANKVGLFAKSLGEGVKEFKKATVDTPETVTPTTQTAQPQATVVAAQEPIPAPVPTAVDEIKPEEPASKE